MRRIVSKNPYTGQVRKQYDFITNLELQVKLNVATQGFQLQRQRSAQERARMVAKLGNVFKRYSKQLAQAITFQMGKPITQANKQVQKTILACNYYSTNFAPILPVHIVSQSKHKTVINYDPLGVVYSIIPYNVPLYLGFKGGLPNLILGNCILARNADSTPYLGELVEKVMIQAGYNHGQYQTIHTNHQQTDQVLKHEAVCGVNFIGSSKVGSVIASKAGLYLKKNIMQLQGNDPFVVLADANINKAVADAIRGRSANCGQICFSPKRFIIAHQLYNQFKQKLIQGLSKLKYGDPMSAETEVGPLGRQDIIIHVENQLKQLPKSYKIIWQTPKIKRPFFPMTVVQATDQTYNHQIFGPVFTLYRSQNQEHSVKLANSGSYGLGAEVYSQSRGQEVISKIRCGMGFVNEVVKSDHDLPSGGIARSGYGRYGGKQGFRQFTNIKLYYIN